MHFFLLLTTLVLNVADCKVLRQIHSRHTCKLRTWDSVVTLTVELSVYHCCYSLIESNDIAGMDSLTSVVLRRQENRNSIAQVAHKKWKIA